MRFLVTQTLRPIKLAFFVPPGDQIALLRAIELATILWGGAYCPILPAYKKLPRAWKEEPVHLGSVESILKGYVGTFDPDFLVPLGGAKDNIPEFDELEVITEDEIVTAFNSDGTPMYGVGIHEILDDLIEKHLRYELRHPLIPVIPEIDRRYVPFLASIVGKLPTNEIDKIGDALVRDFGGQKVGCSLDNFWEFFRHDWLTPRRMSYWNLTQRTSPEPHNLRCIFYLDARNFIDIIDFWNLRAAGFHVMPLPRQRRDDPDLLKHVKEFAERSVRTNRYNPDLKYNANVIKGRTIKESEFEEFAKHTLRPAVGDALLTLSVHYPRLWDEWARRYDVGEIATVKAKETTEERGSVHDELSFNAVAPDFAAEFVGSAKPRFANEIDLVALDNVEPIASVIPQGGPKLAQEISGRSLEHWRLSKRGLVHLANAPGHSASLPVPRAQHVVEKWFETRGWGTGISDAGQIILRLVHHLGGTYGIGRLRDEGMIRLLREITDEQFIGLHKLRAKLHALKSNWGKKDPSLRIQSLIESRFVTLGIRTKCPACGQRTWCSIEDLQPVVRCTECLSDLALPTHSPERALEWTYRAIGPLASRRGAFDAISVLLTHSFFSHNLHGSTTPAFGLTLARSGNDESFELDLALFLRSPSLESDRTELVFAECKSYNEFTRRDASRMGAVAGEFPGVVLVFATLRDCITDKEKRLLRPVVNRGRRYWKAERPFNPVLVLTGTELFSWKSPTNTWEDKGGRHAAFRHRWFESDLIKLCDATQQLYLDMDPWYDWLEDKRAKRTRRRKRKGT